MKIIFKLIDRLLAKPDSLNIAILDKVLCIGIPFNAPHGFKIKNISEEEVVISLPYKKLNHNHLRGIHACAIATVGEFCAGLSLLKIFGISKYRLILSELNVKYLYQGRVELEGYCSPLQIDVENAHKALDAEGKYLQSLKTIIRDLDGNHIAEVSTVWQLKIWDQVKTKS
jgi:acyl-coenzyme A thioesterase PaaI-like protein